MNIETTISDMYEQNYETNGPACQSSFWEHLEQMTQDLQNERLADVFRFISFIPGETYGPHTHLRIEINYVKRGSCSLHLDNKIVRFREGEIMIIAPHVNHLFEAGPNGTTLMQLEFLPEIFSRFRLKQVSNASIPDTVSLFPFGKEHQVIKVIDNIRIVHSLQRIIHEMEAKNPYYQHLVIMYYAELLILIHRYMEEVHLPLCTNKAIRQAVTYMRSNYLSPIAINQVADHVGVSERYLRTLFTTNLNQSPLEYLNRIRVQKAIELLQNTDLSVKEVCFQCGFQSPQYFSRLFKRQTGVAPHTITKSHTPTPFTTSLYPQQNEKQ